MTRLALTLTLCLTLLGGCASGPAVLSCSHGGKFERDGDAMTAECEGQMEMSNGAVTDNGKAVLGGAAGFIAGLATMIFRR